VTERSREAAFASSSATKELWDAISIARCRSDFSFPRRCAVRYLRGIGGS
jgi:hypothetical protein